MILLQQADDLKTLFNLVKTGWQEKLIFEDPDMHFGSIMPSQKINTGWSTILSMVDQISPSARISYGSNGISPNSVYEFLVETDAFLRLFENSKPKRYTKLQQIADDTGME